MNLFLLIVLLYAVPLILILLDSLITRKISERLNPDWCQSNTLKELIENLFKEYSCTVGGDAWGGTYCTFKSEECTKDIVPPYIALIPIVNLGGLIYILFKYTGKGLMYLFSKITFR